MIHVVASIRVAPGAMQDYLAVLNPLVPEVRTEKGCIEYAPAVDHDLGMPVQVLEPGVVTILETWESPEALRAHLGSGHMLAYREKVKDMVEKVSVRVLREL